MSHCQSSDVLNILQVKASEDDIENRASCIEMPPTSDIQCVDRSRTDSLNLSQSKAKIILSTIVSHQKTQVTKPPPLQERNRDEFISIILGGTLLALNSGYINAIALLDEGYPVTHVTGTATNAGIALGQARLAQFATLILLLFSFLFGCFLAGLMINYTSYHLGRAYGRVFLLGSAILTVAVIIEFNVANTTLFIYLLAVASGLQNGMTTRYSGAVLRTSHITGTITDIGIILGRYVRGRGDADLWRLAILIPLFVTFLFGGTIGTLMHARFGRMAILLNIVLYSTIGVVYSLYIALSLKIPVILAIMSDNYTGTVRDRGASVTSLNSDALRMTTLQNTYDEDVLPETEREYIESSVESGPRMDVR